ncbi:MULTISPECIES: hypothetical protein [unclassified Nocardioides]|uniref:DUF7064 domain-containing protein n=1 Tax=unclassified Nocardioides TaxID=2615069 RepID=UPI0007038198|nr:MULTISPECIES: hypothetical protein [unclassified Nocardioides]KQZ68618.1 hypothetical protein ASD66_15120 [Nocardioides sp. Root151]KRF11750.1 hypothetical protein ASH02_17355 [Nocardioides sp. Soil796]
MITLQDENLHQPGTDPDWQESFYFNWATTDESTFGLTRIGFNPASGKADAVVVTQRDGKAEHVYASVGTTVEPGQLDGPPEGGLRVGDLTYTMLEAGRSWRIQLGDRLDLTWTAFTPIVDFHHGFPGDADEIQHHFEQSGTVTGTATFDGVTHVIDGLGQRDKSWGVREWEGITGWDWIACQFGPDLSFNATRTDINGTSTPVGFVYDAGQVRHVTAVEIDYTWLAPHLPKSATLHVSVEDGTAYVIEATALGSVPLLKNKLFIEETHASFRTEIDGVVRRGVGVLEHAHHVSHLGIAKRLPRLLPVFALAKRGSNK